MCWGLLAPCSKWLFRGGGGASFDGYTLAVARSVLATPCLALLAWVTWPHGKALERADALRFLAAALLVGFGLNLLFQVATQLTSAAHAVLFQGLMPLVLAAVEGVFYHRPLRVGQRAGQALGALGAILVALGRAGHGASLAGDAILFVWLAIFAAYSLVAHKLMERFPPFFVTAVAWGGGFAIVALTGAPFVPGALAHTFVSSQVAAVVFFGVVLASGIVAPAAHASAVRLGGIALATAGSQYAAIAAGLALSFGVLGERLAPPGIGGAALMVAGLALTLLPGPKPLPVVTAARTDVPDARA